MTTSPSRTEQLAAAEMDLLHRAQAAAKNAYAPYSRFAVGAAVETVDGRIFTAANMENASYGLTACAEMGALQAASSAGSLAVVLRVAVVGGSLATGAQREAKATAPCGRCRQLIHEAATIGQREVQVLFADLELTVIVRRTISELLPDSFELEVPE